MSTAITLPSNSWPFPPLDHDQSRAEVHYRNGRADIILGISLSGLDRADRRSMKSSPITVRAVPLYPLVIFLVALAPMTYDMPFSPSVNGPMWRTELLQALLGPEEPAFRVMLVENNIVVRHHRMIVINGFGQKLATMMQSCPPTMTRPDYNNAVEDYQKRYTPSQLMNATVVSIGQTTSRAK